MCDMKKLHFIINPVSGNGKAAGIWKKLKLKLDPAGMDYSSYETLYPGHASELTLQCISEGADIIVAVGGDGTAYEVAQNLIGTGIPFGIIPAGTGNDFIKSLKLPADPSEILDLIMRSDPTTVDAGSINGRVFINVCGIGFDVSVLEHSLKAKKFFKGMIPYLWGVIKTIVHYCPADISLTIDGKHILSRKVLVCSVANGIYIGGGMAISPESVINDGMLDIVVIEDVSRLRMIGYLPGLLGGRILTFKDTTSYKGTLVSISSASGLKLNVDGEIVPYDKADFRVIPGGLRVFCRL